LRISPQAARIPEGDIHEGNPFRAILIVRTFHGQMALVEFKKKWSTFLVSEDIWMRSDGIFGKCVLGSPSRAHLKGWSAVSTQAQMGKESEKKVGELLGEINARIVSQTIKEMTPLGLKLESNGEGQLAGGKLNSRHLETINLFQKTDGTFEWETKALEVTMEGDMAVASARGNGRPSGPTTFIGEGEGLYMTQSPRLSWLNGLNVRVEVTGDTNTREYRVRIWTK
jgi:hypothetical protein